MHSIRQRFEAMCGVRVHALARMLCAGALVILMQLAAFSQQASESADPQPQAERYLSDQALLLKEPVKLQIVDACSEIEKTLRIRVLVKTEVLENIEGYSKRIDSFFTEWIRSIGNDKRGILLYAALPRDSLNGKFSLKVGIGLKYLITRE
ncbi:hypothetical protein KBA41_18850, partial [Candidatus Ozemobacteraceae bacterium]|nr:hypothetical protein [Candidatus Ozemobacteraceae bacterium]